MARSVSSAKLISAVVVEKVSLALSRRGYAAAASPGVVSKGGARSNMMLKKKTGEESNKTTSWVPDPVTGCYRPENHGKELDAAELREMLLKQNARGH